MAKTPLPKPGAISGFTNYSAAEHYLFSLWMSIVRESFEKFGFSPFYPRPFERLEHLAHKGGVEKQIFGVYRLDGEGKTGLALPFDHTVQLALFVAQFANEIPYPYKRYDVGLSFRGERPQTGRYRAFVQADVDIVGRDLETTADSECISAILDVLSRLNIGPYTLHLNHIGVIHSVIHVLGIATEQKAEVLRIVDKHDKLSKEELREELKKIPLSQEVIEKLLEIVLYSGPIEHYPHYEILDEAGKKGLNELTLLISLLGAQEGCTIVFSPAKVRGLDYYTGIVFETLLDRHTTLGSIASGGRYSNLVSDFLQKEVAIEGVGGSIGLTRLFDLVTKFDLVKPERTTTATVLVVHREQELLTLAASAANRLRSHGINTDLYSASPKIKQALTFASKAKIPQVLLVMDKSSFVVKEMDHGTQVEYSSLDEALHALLPSDN